MELATGGLDRTGGRGYAKACIAFVAVYLCQDCCMLRVYYSRYMGQDDLELYSGLILMISEVGWRPFK